MSQKKSLIHIIPSNKWGGVQSYALDICRHYHLQGWDVTAMTRNAVGVDAHFNEHGIRLIHAPLTGFFNIASALILAKELKRMRENKTVVHVHRYRDAFTVLMAMKIARREDIKIVATRHAVRRGQNTILFRKLYSRIKSHIFVSDLAYEEFRGKNERIVLPPDSVYILRNSINIPPAPLIPEPMHGPITALYQGAIVKGKGIETLIDSLSQLKKMKIRLRVCGTGDPDYLDLLRRRAMSRGVMEAIDWNIKSAPSVGQVAEAHFGVIPSTDREACGMSNIMMMAAGRAQVTTSNGAQSEYLEDEVSALLVAPADASALADAIRRLATNQELRNRLATNANALYNRLLSWPHFITTLDKIYSK